MKKITWNIAKHRHKNKFFQLYADEWTLLTIACVRVTELSSHLTKFETYLSVKVHCVRTWSAVRLFGTKAYLRVLKYVQRVDMFHRPLV